MTDERDEHFRKFSSFLPMFGPERYYSSLPNLMKPEALEVAAECLKASPDPESELKAMLEQGWREQIVAGVALLSGGVNEVTLGAMWDAFDADSWVVPQLTVLLSVLDPDALNKMKKRILLGCPVKVRGQENLSALERHVMHGNAAIHRYSNKAWSAVCWRIFLSEPAWMLKRFDADVVWKRMLEPYGYEGADIANGWHRDLRAVRPDLGMPEAFDRVDLPTNVEIAKKWRIPEKRDSYQCPDETLELLFAGGHDPAALVRSLLREGQSKGDRFFEITADTVKSAHATVPLSPGLRTAILSYVRLDWDSDVGVLYLGEDCPELWLLRVDNTLRLRHRTRRRKLEGRIDLTRDRLEHAMTDAICYGAKDTGEMGGGAAMAVYQSCGPEVLEAARQALATTSRQIGDIVYTHAYGHECTVFVGHIISIKTKTSQGDWCPEPERLGEGVYQALVKLPERAKTIAFSCLATGEGRAQPEEIAKLMVGAAKRFFRDFPDSDKQVLFCLPDYEDYLAFQRVV